MQKHTAEWKKRAYPMEIISFVERYSLKMPKI